ncbi:OmpH family outer membrane protein [Winogradskyella sp. DF17]|uniref:OmpH family outer membrane protein n=2 Tax=Winogradskyella pelagia TaxID=2819984 RepID=A0ABS3T4G1_9FLAO|nr:OmpH family outer membrane protein [Winogradskyella sp. DF17]MBO3117144.1 OmpH family outer membrane protein [Winogradskyella sp. DF17]
MKLKVLFLIVIISLVNFNLHAQRGVRIGYIDTEYILQNVPEYQEASSQLDKKAVQWKTEIEKRLSEIEQKKKELNNESVLLTKELYDERFEEISFEEAEIIDIQQKRFGPNGDLMIQKRQLIEPIQDQIFAAVQEIATSKKFDFIFDKSADVVMLYSAERYDISEQVLRTITRSSRRKQVNSKEERKALEEEEVVPFVSQEKDDRQQALEDRKAQREADLAQKRAEREKALEERRKQQEELREAKRREAEERRQATIDARNQKRNGDVATDTVEEATKKTEAAAVTAASAETKEKTEAKEEIDPKKDSKTEIDSTKAKKEVKKDSSSAKKSKTSAEILEEKRQQKIRDREARQKELEERKQKIIEERKKAREEREKQLKKRDSIAKAKKKNGND